MTPAVAAPVFLASIALMLAASALFATRLDHIGLRLGMPETLLGVLTALATDAPEISSAISALVLHEHGIAVGVVVGSNAFNIAAMLGVSAILTARVRARHEALELEGFVALWVVAVACGVFADAFSPTIGLVLVTLVAAPYVALLAAGPRLTRRLPLGIRPLHFIQRSFGESHRRARTIDSHREIAHVVLLIVFALGLIVAGSALAVRSAIDLAHAWSVPEVYVGVFVLSILTSLPEAWTGIRFGLQGRGSALMSDTLNSNSINIVAGIAVPAALGSFAGLGFSGLALFDLVWLLVMTTAAIVLFGRHGGAGRPAGVLLIALYAVFVAVQLIAGQFSP
jgi:cation:H+ antiporter